jgi:polysaccharide export outer membrane protein
MRSNTISWLVALTVLLTGPAARFASAQTPDPSASETAAPVLPAPAAHALESLRIAPGDLLRISVLREPELDRQVRVPDSGEVLLPMIGAVQLRGLNAAEAAAAITQKYLDGHFLKHPDVSVFIEEYPAQQVAVLGQVVHPGALSLPAPKTLIDVLALAGGLTDIADRHITVDRADGSQPAEIFVSNRSDDALEANVLIYPGDKILVPRAGIVYVLGDVGRPGGYVMQNESRMTVLQAIAMAAGANRTASARHVRLLRNRNGQIEEQEIPLRDMQQGIAPDLLLEADDVLYVPFSFGRHIVMGSSSIVASASAALIYAGH